MFHLHKILLLTSVLGVCLFASPIPNSNQFLGLDSDRFEGDMELTDQQIQNGMTDPKYRWPYGEVVYEYDLLFTPAQRDTIRKVMDEISSKTCIRFRSRVPLFDTDYVFIRKGAANSGCWSKVGRIGGRQILNYEAPGCISATGPGPHEMMHSIGFQHEHSRPDRDDYVQIFWENIDPKEKSNFDKILNGTSDFGFAYDYISIMQYPRTAFSSNGKDTMAPIPDPNVPFGTYSHLSDVDAQKVDKMYEGYCPPNN